MKITMLPTVEALDVNEPGDVEIVISKDGKSLWLNADGKCVTRGFKMGRLTIVDRRKEGGSGVTLNRKFDPPAMKQYVASLEELLEEERGRPASMFRGPGRALVFVIDLLKDILAHLKAREEVVPESPAERSSGGEG